MVATYWAQQENGQYGVGELKFKPCVEALDQSTIERTIEVNLDVNVLCIDLEETDFELERLNLNRAY